MTRNTTKELEDWLRAGGKFIGQIMITPAADGWEMRHADDTERTELEVFRRWEDARSIANLDDSGAFRALKTAPTLRRGWLLILPDAHAVRLTLDYFYPAMLGVWLAQRNGELIPIGLKDTLGRQTGMYRITQKLTSEQAQRLAARQCCATSCLKTLLWQIGDSGAPHHLPAEKFQANLDDTTRIPLLCHEACNIFVAAARKMVKEEAQQGS